jgi:hypothetical protein
MLDDCHQPLRAQLRGARVLDAQQSLRGVARDGRALEGRRIVPPVLCRFMRQPWRERPPCCTRSLTPAAPQGGRSRHGCPSRCQSIAARISRCFSARLRAHFTASSAARCT